MKYDFGGYVTKHDVRCTDGRIINKEAFVKCNGKRVPLVYQHDHNDISHVLGYVDLEHRDDGVYGYGTFNETPNGKNAKSMVEHGDIEYMSIYANKIQQRGANVIHGEIKEVSLVLAGANPGARIDNLSMTHGDYEETIEDEAVIYSGEVIHSELTHADALKSNEPEKKEPVNDKGDESMLDIFNTLSQKQADVVYAMIAAALEAAEDDEIEQSDEEGDDDMGYNMFEGSKNDKTVLSHDQLETIFTDAKRNGSLKDAVLAHADDFGIGDVELLFPEARSVNGNSPEFIKRRTEWVNHVLSTVRRTPFARLRMMTADITADEARAKGYIKGNMKKEEFFSVAKREVTPTTIYKKQKLHRDDIIDIKDFDVVAWLKGEMRLMLEEEIARAVLVGDGREADSADKIHEEHLIPIVKDKDLYAIKKDLPAAATPDEELDQLITMMGEYEGTGTPDLYVPRGALSKYRVIKDKNGRRIYSSDAEIAALLGVKTIHEVPVMNGTKVDGKDLVGVIVNLEDYTIGADKGGEVSFFDDFDIDYNQMKYLYETRISGCLTKIKSAIVITRPAATRSFSSGNA